MMLAGGAALAGAPVSLRARRAVVAVRACFVGDCAAMPVHWLYDDAALREALQGQLEAPEFFSRPSCPYYDCKRHPGHYALGQPSPYGEEALALADCLEQGGLDLPSPDAWAQSLYAWSKQYGGRKNACTRLFEHNMDTLVAEGVASVFPRCGALDSEANALWKVPLLCARYAAAPPDLLRDKVRVAVRVHQNTDASEQFAQALARMLRAALHGAELAAAVDAARTDAPPAVKDALDLAVRGAIASAAPDAAGHAALHGYLAALAEHLFAARPGLQPESKPFLAKSCALPASFILAVKIVLDTDVMLKAHGAHFDALTWALRRNIMAGGDQCGRVALVAALVAAATNKDVPLHWQDKTSAALLKRIDKLAHGLAAKGKL
jgi:hypothetical protein